MSKRLIGSYASVHPNDEIRGQVEIPPWFKLETLDDVNPGEYWLMYLYYDDDTQYAWYEMQTWKWLKDGAVNESTLFVGGT